MTYYAKGTKLIRQNIYLRGLYLNLGCACAQITIGSGQTNYRDHYLLLKSNMLMLLYGWSNVEIFLFMWFPVTVADSVVRSTRATCTASFDCGHITDCDNVFVSHWYLHIDMSLRMRFNPTILHTPIIKRTTFAIPVLRSHESIARVNSK